MTDHAAIAHAILPEIRKGLAAKKRAVHRRRSRRYLWLLAVWGLFDVALGAHAFAGSGVPVVRVFGTLGFVAGAITFTVSLISIAESAEEAA